MCVKLVLKWRSSAHFCLFIREKPISLQSSPPITKTSYVHIAFEE